MNDLAAPLDNFEYEREEIKSFFDNTYLSSLLKHKEQANHIGSFNIKQSFIENAFPKLNRSLKKYINIEDILFARFFITLPESKGDIHIDTQNGQESLYRNLTLNIPLTDCLGTYHEWYDTGTDSYNDFSHSALYWRNYDSGKLIDRYELVKPSILKVSVPHRIWNPLKTYRIILSIRTASDTFNF